MADIKITVEGPGGTLGAPVLAIRQALEAIGCRVRIEDKHPMALEDAQMIIDKRAFKGTHIVLEAKHYCWGG